MTVPRLEPVLDRPFTPQYASPEQVQGFPVTTAVDIYSLGAVFYEMLTGQRAQRIDSLSLSEIERVVCHTEVTPPSLLAPDLDADLDNIVLMAMRKEPARRYQSADQMGPGRSRCRARNIALASIDKDNDVLSVHREARERTESLVREIAAHRAQ